MHWVGLLVQCQIKAILALFFGLREKVFSSLSMLVVEFYYMPFEKILSLSNFAASFNHVLIGAEFCQILFYLLQ